MTGVQTCALPILVLDSSVALAWVYAEEVTGPIREVFQQITKSGAWVPGIWRLEVANVLEAGARRGRHDAAFQQSTVADLAALPIQTDAETDRHAWARTAALATRHRLTTYDAAYLELALRRELPLATLDRELRLAASAEKVALLGI